MSKCRSMYAGSSGAVYNVNGMHPGNGNNKWQGLVSTTNMRSSLIPYVRTRADSDNRNVVFCMNQLGGVGRKSTMFATTADGVKLPCQGSKPNIVDKWVSSGIKINSIDEWVNYPPGSFPYSLLPIDYLYTPGTWFYLVRGTPLQSVNSVLNQSSYNTVMPTENTNTILLVNETTKSAIYMWNAIININGNNYTIVSIYDFDPLPPDARENNIDNTLISFMNFAGAALYWIAGGGTASPDIYAFNRLPTTYKNYSTNFYLKLGTLFSFSGFFGMPQNDITQSVYDAIPSASTVFVVGSTTDSQLFTYTYTYAGGSLVLNIEVGSKYVYYDKDIGQVIAIGGISSPGIVDIAVFNEAIAAFYSVIRDAIPIQ